MKLYDGIPVYREIRPALLQGKLALALVITNIRHFTYHSKTRSYI